jgi:type III secretion protein R
VNAENVAIVVAVAVVPLVALMLSAFVKVSVVLALLRNAIGSPLAPPNLVVTGLALLITAFVMMPVAEQVAAAVKESPTAPAPGPAPAPAVAPQVPAQVVTWLAAADRAQGPVKAFLAKHAHAEDRATFVALARDLRGADVADDDLLVLAAAFVTSELTEAFAIAFLVFLPFLVLDLVVGIGLGALGLSSTPPSTVSLPLKLILFVAVDGWRVLVDGLARGYT